jgi:hypothetical protein
MFFRTAGRTLRFTFLGHLSLHRTYPCKAKIEGKPSTPKVFVLFKRNRLKRKMYDVCIVGAGIAGSALAYNLCPSLKTCVIEKAEMSGLGKKPCGDAVHAWWFKGGIEPKPERLNAVLQRIRRIELNLKGEKFSKELSGEREGIMIDRHKFVRGGLMRAVSSSALRLGRSSGATISSTLRRTGEKGRGLRGCIRRQGCAEEPLSV